MTIQTCLAKQVIAAAESVGIRIVLLRTAYLRAGFELPPDRGQMRFYESAKAFLDNMAALVKDVPTGNSSVHFGVAPHSVRAVPLGELHEIAAWARANRIAGAHACCGAGGGERGLCSRVWVDAGRLARWRENSWA
jgi:cytosine/adenosine deaminase-related metal-dependent hydrolase